MTPQEIATASNCMGCIVDKGAAIIYQLNALRVQNGGAAMTPQEIQEAAKCYGCIVDKGAAQTYLMDALLTAVT